MRLERTVTRSPHRTSHEPAESRAEAAALGQMIREMRVALQRDLEDAAADLRIKPAYLRAIEDGRFEDLPGAAYATGFLRAYADYLGANGDEVIRRYKAVITGLDTRTALVLPSPVEDGRLPAGSLLLLAGIFALAAYGGWYYLSLDGRDPIQVVTSVPDRIVRMVEAEFEDAGSATIDLTTAAEARDAGGAPAVAEARAPEPAKATPPQAMDEPTPQAMDEPLPQATEAPAPAVADGPEGPRSVAPATAARTESPAAPGPARPETAPASESESAPEIVLAPEAGPMAPEAPATRANDAAPAPHATVAEVSGPADAAVSEPPDQEARQHAAPPPPADAPAAAAADGIRPSPADAAAEPPGSPPGSPPESPPESPPGSPPEVAAAIPPPPPPAAADAVTDAAADAEDAADGAAATAAPAPAASPRQIARAARGASRIVLRARDWSWVEVRDSGDRTMYSGLMRAGETVEVPSVPGLTLATGNAGGVEIVIDGQVMPSLGPRGAVRRDVSLNVESLRSRAD